MDNIKRISIEDKNYPELLKKISDPPKFLYYRGDINSIETCFAIVGTRRCSSYGKEAALEIAGDLAESGLTIVSGLAPGIDTFSHLACVERNKRTIAVLGTGLDERVIYPKSNLKLASKIIENGGCLISELEPENHGTKYTFPNRNRIISGLSIGVLVVEAKEKSGSLITANYAKIQKKKIFAIPGQIFSQNSRGPHKLIKEGAKLVENSQDILSELDIKHFVPKFKEELAAESLEEKLILEALEEGSLYIDKIIEKTKLEAQAVSTKLALMEISGKVRNLGASVYAIT